MADEAHGGGGGIVTRRKIVLKTDYSQDNCVSDRK